MRYAAAYPALSGLANAKPRTGPEWVAVYRSACALLGKPLIQQVLLSSYQGVYVDEYQDCTEDQHLLILAIAAHLPTRILGDPLQAIFGFGPDRLVAWTAVQRDFPETLPPLATPHRWVGRNEELGRWLLRIRPELERTSKVDLTGAPVTWHQYAPARAHLALAECQRIATSVEGTVAVIHKWPNQSEKFAQQTRGRFSCLEPIDLEDLFKAAKKIEDTQGVARVEAVVDFATLCMSNVSSELGTVIKVATQGSAPRSKAYKHQHQLDALRLVSTNQLSAVAAALNAISAAEGITVYRRELLRSMINAVQGVASGEAASLTEAAWETRNRLRHAGRTLGRLVAGRTVLVKGLEFDHAILIDPDQFARKEDLYVALTRGARSLTVFSSSRQLGIQHS